MELYFNEFEHKLFISIKGPPGQDGMPGQMGAPGMKGERGERGDPGRDGSSGEPGIRGSPGPTGKEGPLGPPGLTSNIINYKFNHLIIHYRHSWTTWSQR